MHVVRKAVTASAFSQHPGELPPADSCAKSRQFHQKRLGWRPYILRAPGRRPLYSTASFSQRSRLSSAGAYQRVFNNACGKSSDRTLMVLATTNGLKHARLGLAIAKKKLPAATARNRIKRVIRESFRHHQQSLCGLDIVVLNNANAGSTVNNELFRILETHWNVVITQCRKS